MTIAATAAPTTPALVPAPAPMPAEVPVPVPADPQLRVLLRTATSKDAVMTTAVLAHAGIEAHVCTTLHELLREIPRGAGALLVSEEMLSGTGAAELADAVSTQPPWSDLPVLILARQGADSRAITTAMEGMANVTVLERPIRVASLVSALRSALRARRRQYELRKILEDLSEADKRKTEFLATLAHELRNPLAPLSTALAILKRKTLAPEAALPYYELMGRQVEHMVRLVNDLMEVSRITRGKIELQLGELALDQVIRGAVELSRPLMDAGRHTLALHMPDASLAVEGDSVRLTQVFSNLLNNAAKYTPEGGRIDVFVERGAHGHAVVRVKDSGAGIPPAMLGAIFDMFVQVSGTARAAQGGLGIGLTLVKSLVELHGGTVSAKSEGANQGSEFTVSLPLLDHDVRAGTHARASLEAVAAQQRILVVDDNRDAAESLAALLGLLGAQTAVAFSGTEALRMAEGFEPTLGILDIGMPGMDGCELARRLRAHPQHHGMGLIALTGWGQSDDRVRIARAGFDHHLLKPVDEEELSLTLRKLGQRGSG
ncbi:His Kinase A (phospho-acceptor) domain-containing protein [Variovorax sp. OK605]|uniref:hybrid sensor histidine kinase/response regulator n=1 Tax=Variovorax sp. OK605 TaxID=1855317 RepID=UPI0008F12ECC|nr:hybrid sensor histidine kinase/response regulator [Variovorax sp. OK605]SFQ65112.1 His Kinase A (phospho-acceptor) domain-containing protein [Variovorax sp. OK605]